MCICKIYNTIFQVQRYQRQANQLKSGKKIVQKNLYGLPLVLYNGKDSLCSSVVIIEALFMRFTLEAYKSCT